MCSVFVLCNWKVLYGSRWRLCTLGMIEVFRTVGCMLGLWVCVSCFFVWLVVWF